MLPRPTRISLSSLSATSRNFKFATAAHIVKASRTRASWDSLSDVSIPPCSRESRSVAFDQVRVRPGAFSHWDERKT